MTAGVPFLSQIAEKIYSTITDPFIRQVLNISIYKPPSYFNDSVEQLRVEMLITELGIGEVLIPISMGLTSKIWNFGSALVKPSSSRIAVSNFSLAMLEKAAIDTLVSGTFSVIDVVSGKLKGIIDSAIKITRDEVISANDLLSAAGASTLFDVMKTEFLLNNPFNIENINFSLPIGGATVDFKLTTNKTLIFNYDELIQFLKKKFSLGCTP